MRSLKDSVYGVVDLGTVLMIGIVFAAILIFAYIIWTINDQMLTMGGVEPGDTLWPWNTLDGGDSVNASMNATYLAEENTRNSLGNMTGGFDNAISLLLIAITIFILAIAISALLLLRRGR